MKSPLLRAIGFFLLFTLLTSFVSWFRDGALNQDVIINAAIVGAITATLLYFWNFKKAKSQP